MRTTLLPQLQTFLVAARRKSFSATARELGVSPAAVSQSVRQLEEQLRVVLFTRTTRSVALTDAGRRLLEGAGPALGQVLASMEEISAQPGEAVGRLKLTVPEIAVPFVLTPVLPAFRARHPRVEVEVVVENRLADIVAEGYDAGVRLHEAIERDMVQVRLTDAFRFVVVGPRRISSDTARPAAPRTCCGTSASPSASLRAGRCSRGSSSVGAGTGACRCEAAWSRTTAN
jgi:DNA-binding transcriptional LysR family regulator